jgi:methyl-accepting chemotaxis protein
MFPKTTIRTLLLSGFSIIIGLISVMTVITFQRSNSVSEHVSAVTEDAYPKVSAASDIRTYVLRNWSNSLLLLLVVDATESKRITDEMVSNSKIISDKLDFLDKSISSEGGRQNLDALKKARIDYTESRKQYLALVKAGNKSDADHFLTGTLQSKLEAYVSAIGKLMDFQSSKMNILGDETFSLASSLKSINIGLSLLVLLVSAITAIVVTKAIINSLGGEVFYASNIVHQIAAGNLSVEIHTAPGDNSSLLAAMKKMRDQLGKMVSSIQNISFQVGVSARELAQASQSVADSSIQQNTATVNAAADIEQMTLSISHIAGNIGNAHSFAIHSENLSQKGGAIIHNAASEMEKIAASVEASSVTISNLEHRSNEISAVVNIIKEIAEQTNLLALNAAIEAARAGEQGRGFAVVADEVRKLAERTTMSTQEISVTIKKIQEDTTNAVQTMVASVEQVKLGLILTQQAGTSIVEIESEAKHVTEVVNEISNSIKEQTGASNDVARNIEKIAIMVEENNTTTGRAADAAQKLEVLAGELTNSIGSFRL